MKTYRWFCLLGFCAAAFSARASLALTVTQGEESDLAASYGSSDLIEGLIPVELPPYLGWYPANTDLRDQLPAFTEGTGMRDGGLTGLLADFPGAGSPAKRIQYTLAAPDDISEVRVFSGNDGRDGRVFHTYTVEISSDSGQTFTAPIYVQSHPSGTINDASQNNWRVVLSQLQNTDGFLARGVTDLRLGFYAVANIPGEARDPFDGFNPFTGSDDGLDAPYVSPMVWEIDVLGQPSPGTLAATRTGTNVVLSWVTALTGAVLQATTNVNPTNWQNLSPQPAITVTGTTNRAVVPIGAGSRFFRVRY
jgi:hypothetical protein